MMKSLVTTVLLSAAMASSAFAQAPQGQANKPATVPAAQKAPVALPAPTPLPPTKEEPGAPIRKRLMTPQDLKKHQQEGEASGQQVKAPPVVPQVVPAAQPPVKPVAR